MDVYTTDPSTMLTAAAALKLVTAFFEKEWPQTIEEEIDLRRVTGGFCHRLHLITRNNEARQEPKSILIRHFGLEGNENEPLESSTTLSAAEQTVIYHEMGRRGWGPKVYGVFRGGRLEEYIDAHVLTAAESMQLDIRHDIARSFARLHSLELPFRKDSFTRVICEFKGVANKKAEAVQKLLGLRSSKATQLATFIRNMDWSRELDWLSELFERYKCKRSIAIIDVNFSNVLVKNYKSENQILLIDYETAAYSYRGIDIGGHFSERMYCWSHPDNVLSGHPAPNLEEQTAFCESYMQEMQVLGQETTNDTVSHLILESEIGRMYQMVFSFLMCIRFEGFESSSPLVVGLVNMAEIYCQLKHDFASRHETPC
ncbi:kinase-like protein [Pseudovirgaria hyperparasitica]|uniref:Kinase-like protein n=1 Tax=Pseudovirgaria hyperparasitica TaxID=470096 RepID=A0A6A6WA29_9PEZI|nr:kinase-like protein [Pseudovirgaria hyperparasitica]KAF2758810.1 kinase-like protein [Pseudovirgaria hyperparasitica]